MTQKKKKVESVETMNTSDSNVNQEMENKSDNTPMVDANQSVETNAYVPTYRVKPELKMALLKAIGHLPFNQIAGLINAVDVAVLDHNTLTQIVNAIGQFPYTSVEPIMKNIGNYLTQVMDE